MLTNIIVWIIIGAIAGWLAGSFMKSKQGLITNIVVGIVGSFIGGFIFDLMDIGGGNIIGSIFIATIGAVILLAILKRLK